jgi:hypothetical protein
MIRNAATPKHDLGISTVGSVPDIHHEGKKLPAPTTIVPLPQRRSHHLSRGDGSAYWEHNQGR